MADQIAALLDAQQLVIADRELVRCALGDYRESSADFPDHLVAWLGRLSGPRERPLSTKRPGRFRISSISVNRTEPGGGKGRAKAKLETATLGIVQGVPLILTTLVASNTSWA